MSQLASAESELGLGNGGDFQESVIAQGGLGAPALPRNGGTNQRSVRGWAGKFPRSIQAGGQLREGDKAPGGAGPDPTAIPMQGCSPTSCIPCKGVPWRLQAAMGSLLGLIHPRFSSQIL